MSCYVRAIKHAHSVNRDFDNVDNTRWNTQYTLMNEEILLTIRHLLENECEPPGLPCTTPTRFVSPLSILEDLEPRANRSAGYC
jgi:hypothetical protein